MKRTPEQVANEMVLRYNMSHKKVFRFPKEFYTLTDEEKAECIEIFKQRRDKK